RITADAAGEFLTLANAAGAGDIDVDVFFVLRIEDQGVRVRTAATLNGSDLLRIGDIGDVENADTAEAVLAGRRQRANRAARRPIGIRRAGRRRGSHVALGRRIALDTAIGTAVHGFGRHEHQVAVDRDIALAAGAHDRAAQFRAGRIVDIVEVDAVVV